MLKHKQKQMRLEKTSMRKVRIVCSDIKDNKPVKSKTITLYECESEEVIDLIIKKLSNNEG